MAYQAPQVNPVRQAKKCINICTTDQDRFICSAHVHVCTSKITLLDNSSIWNRHIIHCLLLYTVQCVYTETQYSYCVYICWAVVAFQHRLYLSVEFEQWVGQLFQLCPQGGFPRGRARHARPSCQPWATSCKKGKEGGGGDNWCTQTYTCTCWSGCHNDQARCAKWERVVLCKVICVGRVLFT